MPALGRKPSSLATPAEFPTAMLSHTRHLASAKLGGGAEGWTGGTGTTEGGGARLDGGQFDVLIYPPKTRT